MDKINCTTSEQIKDSSKIWGQNIFFINKKYLEKFLKDNFFCIKNINISRNIPDSIKIDVKGREAVAKLVLLNWEASASSLIDATATPSAQQFGETFLVDDEGIIFSKDFMDITKINVVNGNLSLGMKVNDFIISSLKTLSGLKRMGINPSGMTLIDNFLVIDGTPKVIINLSRSIDTQIASLQLILNKAKIDDVNMDFIDLRFDKPVAKFAPKKR